MRGLGVLGLFALATAWVLWPLPRDAADHILDVQRFYGRAGWLFAADPWLCMWILAWDTHALLAAPARLFDANIFHPAPLTLALSEHLLGYWPLFAPVYLATRNAVLAYDATIFLAFVLSGAAMCRLVRGWTGELAAGVLAGVVFAFAPWRLSQLAHVQLLGLYGLPLVLVFWDGVLRGGGRRQAIGLGAVFLGQCLCSYYLAYTTAIATALYAGITAPGAPRMRIARAAGALAAGGLVFALVSLPYTWVRASGLLPEQGLEAQAVMSVGSWRPYLVPEAIGPAMRPFQGRVALGLAALGLVAGVAGRRRPIVLRALALAAILAAGVALAAGPAGGLYGWLWRWLPGFSSTRVPARFVILTAFAVAALAGLGWSRVAGRLGRRARVAATALACVLVAWDVGLFGFQCPLAAVPPLAPVYGWLAAHGDGTPLLELPARAWMGDLAGALREQHYAYASTRHWLPQLTGRSGHVPPSYALVLPLVGRLPDGRALDRLVALTGLRWIVVHGADARWDADRVAGLELAATVGTARVYRVRRAPVAAWQAELVERLWSGRETDSFEGTPLVPLAARDLAGRVTRVEAPERVPLGALVPVALTAVNEGRRTWPGLAVRSTGLVVVRARWTTAGGRAIRPAVPALRLLGDVPPGGVADVAAFLPTPGAAGRYRLVLRVAQGDERGAVGTRVVRRVEVTAP